MGEATWLGGPNLRPHSSQAGALRMALKMIQAETTNPIKKKMPAGMAGCPSDRTTARARPQSAMIATKSARKNWGRLRATAVLRAGVTAGDAFVELSG